MKKKETKLVQRFLDIKRLIGWIIVPLNDLYNFTVTTGIYSSISFAPEPLLLSSWVFILHLIFMHGYYIVLHKDLFCIFQHSLLFLLIITQGSINMNQI